MSFSVKNKLHQALQRNTDFSTDDVSILNPCQSQSIDVALNFLRNPFKMCERINELIQELNTNKLEELCQKSLIIETSNNNKTSNRSNQGRRQRR